MGEEDRVKRPKLQRAKAIRSWSTLFVTPPPTDSRPDSKDGARFEGNGDVVSRSVDLGYRVIDEYIREGRRTAQRLSSGSWPFPIAMGRDTQELTTQMTRYAAEMTSLWMEFVQLAMGNPRAWPASGSSTVSPVPKPPHEDTRPTQEPRNETTRRRLKVIVASPYPTEVSVDLRPDAASRLSVQSLRSATVHPPRLTTIGIEDSGADGALTLRIRVPAGQAPGLYVGSILEEETNRVVGTVTLRITSDVEIEDNSGRP